MSFLRMTTNQCPICRKKISQRHLLCLPHERLCPPEILQAANDALVAFAALPPYTVPKVTEAARLLVVKARTCVVVAVMDALKHPTVAGDP